MTTTTTIGPVALPRRAALLAAPALLLGAGGGAALGQSRPTDAQRAERWAELRAAILGDRAGSVVPAGDAVRLVAPDRALDAALVPVSWEADASLGARAAWLVIAENPSPLALHLVAGEAGDLSAFSTRVRVDAYTNLHLVLETADGRLVEQVRFVRAAGGCAAPVGADLNVARQRMGRMRFRLAAAPEPGKPTAVQVAVSHPNLSGLQRDQLTLLQIPADFVREVRATYGGREVLRATTDISIAEDPTFGFVLAASQGPGEELALEASDISGRRFRGAWRVGGAA